MKEQIWTLTYTVLGNFFLVQDERVTSPPPFPTIRRFIIDPEFDEHDNQTGVFTMSIEFAMAVSDEKPRAISVADTGRDMIDYFLSLLTFLSGYPVRVLKPPELTHNYPGTNKFRRISFPSKQAMISPPVALANTSLFNIVLDPKVRSILTWFRKGFEEKNTVDSFVSLCVALELLANQFKMDKIMSRACPKCGHKAAISPGMRQHVEHVLVVELGCPKETFKAIWEERNKVLHGGFSKAAESERELHGIRADLLAALVRGINKLLGIKSTDLPYEQLAELLFTDPILDIEYTLPDS
jgi:hypothetical protein